MVPAGLGPGLWLACWAPSQEPSALCRKGLTFVSVHDCFWTHAADVPVMNQVRPSLSRVYPTPREDGHGPLNLPLSVGAGPSDWGGRGPTDARPQVCREQFINLHSQPILQDLSQFLVQRFCSRPR